MAGKTTDLENSGGLSPSKGRVVILSIVGINTGSLALAAGALSVGAGFFEVAVLVAVL